MNEWDKLEPIEGNSKGCFNCGSMHKTFPMEGLIAIGFGFAGVIKGDVLIYSEPINSEDPKDYWTGQDAENMALGDPDHDWRIQIDGPLYSSHYQRQGWEHWVLVYKDAGFA